jgi:hypothetical protein
MHAIDPLMLLSPMRLAPNAESVNEGHPDKLCDQVSDAILDACLEQDPESKVACETASKTNMVRSLPTGKLFYEQLQFCDSKAFCHH